MTKKIRLVLFILLSLIPLVLCRQNVYAQDDDEGYSHFDKSYQGKLNGYLAHDIVEVAKAQKGKTKTDLGLSNVGNENNSGYRHAYFLVNCERLAGAEKPYVFDLPTDKYVNSVNVIKESLLESHKGIEIDREDAVPGDIVFYNNESGYSNCVRIVIDYGAQNVTGFGGFGEVRESMGLDRSGYVSFTFIHPNYPDFEPVSSTGIKLQDFKYEVADSYYDYVAGKQIDEEVVFFDGYTGKEDTLKIPAVINLNGVKRKVILRRLFEYNKNIKHVSFENGAMLTQDSYGNIRAFDFSGLESIDLEGLDISHVNSLNELLKCCESLKKVYHAETLDTKNITSLEDVFGGCLSLQSLDINSWDVSKVTNMCELLENCRSLTSITLDKWDTSNVTNFKRTFFMTGIADLDVSTWNFINSNNFDSTFESQVIKNLKLPKNFKFVEQDTFRLVRGCTIYFQGTKKQWNDLWENVSTNSFSDTITVICSDGTYKHDEEAEAAPKYGTVLTDTKSGMKYVVIRSGKKDGKVRFKGVTKKAKKITIPATVKIDGITYKVTEIESGALKGNKSVRTIVVGKNVTKIGNMAFCNCKNLTSLTLGSGLRTIEKKAIYNTSIKSLVLPANAVNLSNQFIGKCSKLRTLTIKSTVILEDSRKKVFAGLGKNVTVKVPKKKLRDYKEIFPKIGLNKKAKIMADKK